MGAQVDHPYGMCFTLALLALALSCGQLWRTSELIADV